MGYNASLMGPTSNASLAVALRNDPAEIPRLHDLVDRFGEQNGLTEDSLWAVKLALEELIVNVMNYAFPEPGERRSLPCSADRRRSNLRPFQRIQAVALERR